MYPNVPKISNLPCIFFIFQFTEVPYGALQQYIMQDIDNILNVQHLADTFVVNSLSDVAPLKRQQNHIVLKYPILFSATFQIP